MRIRTLAAMPILAVAALGLVACEKPAPGISVTSGTTTAYREALCWSFDGSALSAENCAQDLVTNAVDGGQAARIPVIPGTTIGISVDPVVADTGWYPVIGTQKLTEQPLTTTYYRFTYPDLQEVPASGVPLQVVAADGADTVGLWVFALVPGRGVS